MEDRGDLGKCGGSQPGVILYFGGHLPVSADIFWEEGATDI